MTLLLLLAVLPTLSQENYAEVRQLSDTQVVNVLFVMDGCIPCEQIKLEVPPNTYIVHNKKQSQVFSRMTQGKVHMFPTLGVLHKGKATFYSGATKIRKLLELSTRTRFR